jgi:hypothetical protein
MNPPHRRTLALAAIFLLAPFAAPASGTESPAPSPAAASPSEKPGATRRGPVQTGPTAAPSASGSPAPGSSPAAGASATPRPLGFRAASNLALTFVDQSTAGPGRIAPEAGGFIAGAPLAPNTPYDLFSSAPQVPGAAGVAQLVSTFGYGFRAFDVGVTTGLGYVRGSVTNAAYWSESLLPALNPHLGSQALAYRVAFPTHPGQDDATAVRLSVLSGTVATADGNLRLRGGWFDLAQTDRFVFAQPSLTSANPAIAYAPAESLTSGVPNADFWQPYASALPLHGADLVAKRGPATLELSSAALPSLPGEGARIALGSLVVDRGEGTRYSAEVAHVTTSGTAFGTTVPFGADPSFALYPQGVLPASALSGQRQTIAGVRAAFHAIPAASVDAVAEIGRAWYDASPASRPGTQAPGGYYHLGLARRHGRATASLDYFRMEPRYATAILPYGVPENQWSAAFAWPGQWLKSNYQLVDDGVLGVNRQGYRLRYYVDEGPLEVHAEFVSLRQIDAETRESATRAGFVDGYYLPQFENAATFGTQKRTGLWVGWHPRFGDVTLDLVDDTEYRPFSAAHPEDVVAYEVPQAVVTYSRRFSPALVGAAGLGRYAMKGAFAEPIDYAQRLAFAGVQVRQTARASLLATFRRTAFSGITTFPASPRSPAFTGSALIVEQRYGF